jgi:predicted NUDIX family NTP pyrophosphohydrolase
MKEITSCGLLMYCNINNDIKVFLVHPGGPFFAKKDEGYWGIPKGLTEPDEELLNTAKREFFEETGITPGNTFIPLGTVLQNGTKRVHCWAFECTSDAPIDITCNTFSMEWPPKSGKYQDFPEVDRGCFFGLDEAYKKIFAPQAEFINRLLDELGIKANKQVAG